MWPGEIILFAPVLAAILAGLAVATFRAGPWRRPADAGDSGWRRWRGRPATPQASRCGGCRVVEICSPLR